MATAARPSWLVVEGVLLIVLGVASLVLPWAAALAAALVFGWILVLSGILGVVGAFAARARLHPGWSLVSGLIALVVGGLMLWAPLAGAIGLTLLLAAYLAADGVVLIVLALDQRRRRSPRWGWLLFSAIADLLLAVAIVALSPFTAPMVLGVVVGIDLILAGAAVLALASHRAAPEPTGAAVAR
jgi:uncharacterized membrane protein HdeD (DUF308 family)